MNLTPAMKDFILHWGDMGDKWGVNRSVAQIHALLHIAPHAMTQEEICETLNLARSNVSNALKELQGWKLVTASRELGERKDRYTSIRDMFDLVTTVVEARRDREFAPTLEQLHKVAENAKEDGTGPKVQARIEETLKTMQMFDDWYSDVSRMPRSVQLAMVKLGAGIARFIPGGKS